MGQYDHVPDGMTADTLPPAPVGAFYECNSADQGCVMSGPHEVHEVPGRHVLTWFGANDWPWWRSRIPVIPRFLARRWGVSGGAFPAAGVNGAFPFLAGWPQPFDVDDALDKWNRISSGATS